MLSAVTSATRSRFHRSIVYTIQQFSILLSILSNLSVLSELGQFLGQRCMLGGSFHVILIVVQGMYAKPLQVFRFSLFDKFYNVAVRAP